MTAAAEPEGFRHYTDVRVRFADTDAQRVVYHANFLVYCEVARTEYFRAAFVGRSWRLGADLDVVIARAACDYRASARFDDLLRVWVRLSRLGTSSFGFQHRIVRDDGQLVCEVETVQVGIERASGKPAPLPADWTTTLRAFEAGAPSR